MMWMRSTICSILSSNKTTHQSWIRRDLEYHPFRIGNYSNSKTMRSRWAVRGRSLSNLGRIVLQACQEEKSQMLLSCSKAALLRMVHPAWSEATTTQLVHLSWMRMPPASTLDNFNTNKGVHSVQVDFPAPMEIWMKNSQCKWSVIRRLIIQTLVSENFLWIKYLTDDLEFTTSGRRIENACWVVITRQHLHRIR